MSGAKYLRDRHAFTAQHVVRDIWESLSLPSEALKSLHLPGHTDPVIASSFKIGILAQSSIALSSLAAALVHRSRTTSNGIAGPIPAVRVPLEQSVAQFKCETLYTIDGKPPKSTWAAIGGLHKASDGYVRIHASFANHASGTLKLLGLPSDATHEQVSGKTASWAGVDLETTAVVYDSLAVYALRSYSQWDSLPQARAVSDWPVSVRQLTPGPPKAAPADTSAKCLQGLRVVEMSRVIAAPVAGKTLASHGADVIWITSPELPDLPELDRELSRGKKTVQLDIKKPTDKERLIELLCTADVFIQGYRPGSLASQGLSPEELTRINPNIICANMSAFGPDGPWSHRRGFDSLVQTCTGMNVSEAEHAGKGEVARPMPCQALDHAGGFLLATGIITAIHHRSTKGGSWQVDGSLAGVMKYLRSLGQYPGATGFECQTKYTLEDLPPELFDGRDSEFGKMRYLKASSDIEGCEVGWDKMPRPLGSDKAEWG